ncbi:MAG: hypothetical protein EOM14_00375 [Clostridia bacterium]|nr:hypothetical protein [Clostridia bacterium]
MNTYMDPGKGVEVVADNGGIVVMQARNGTGTGVMTLHDVLHEVIVVYNDFHMREIKSEFSARTDLLYIDYCREGRIEQKLRPGASGSEHPLCISGFPQQRF